MLIMLALKKRRRRYVRSVFTEDSIGCRHHEIFPIGHVNRWQISHEIWLFNLIKFFTLINMYTKMSNDMIFEVIKRTFKSNDFVLTHERHFDLPPLKHGGFFYANS